MRDQPEILTPRLRATPIGDRDFDALFAMHQDPRVMATLAPAGHPRGGMLDAEETRHYLRANLAHWRDHGFGLWVFRRPASDEVVGRAGLKRATILDKREVELAYALRSEHWNAGYATEMGTAVLDWGFTQGGLEEAVCFTATTNGASRRVMAKLGFQYEQDFMHAGLPHLLCRLTAGAWRARSAASPPTAQQRD